MKFLKYLGLTILVLAGIYLIWAAFLPAVLHVERSMLINADAQTAYDNVNTLKSWKKWSYWDNIDSAMKSEYSGPEAGVGAIHKWESAHENVGKGSLEITKSEPNSWVETKLTFEGMGEHLGGWKFRDSAGGVFVTSYMDMNNSYWFRPLMVLFGMEKVLGDDFEKSLSGLKTLSESAPKITPVQMEDVTMPPMKVVTLSARMENLTPKEMSMKFGEMYGQLGAFIKENKVNQVGPVFVIYSNYKDGSFDAEAGIPVDNLPKAGKDNIRVYETAETKAYKALHLGPYSNLMNFHMGINAFLESKGNSGDGPRWEMYTNDPGVETDSTKWQTEVYVPY